MSKFRIPALALVLLLVTGCGMLPAKPEPLPVDPAISDAAQIAQSLADDIKAIQEAKTESGETAKVNWAKLAWAFLIAGYLVIYFAEKCSDRWGIPSKATLARMSYYLTKSLPVTQRTIYIALRLKHLKRRKARMPTAT